MYDPMPIQNVSGTHLSPYLRKSQHVYADRDQWIMFHRVYYTSDDVW